MRRGRKLVQRERQRSKESKSERWREREMERAREREREREKERKKERGRSKRPKVKELGDSTSMKEEWQETGAPVSVPSRPSQVHNLLTSGYTDQHSTGSSRPGPPDLWLHSTAQHRELQAWAS